MNSKQRLIISVVTFLAFALMSVGFATYRITLNVAGVATFTKNGKIAITNVELVSSSNITDPHEPSFTDDSINFNLDFTVDDNSALADEYSATYEITLSNTSFYNYIFASSVFTPSIETSSNENLDVTFTIEGVDIGDTIASGEAKTFTATFNMYPKEPGDYNVSGESQIGTEQGDTPTHYSLLSSIPNGTTIDLRGDTTRARVRVTVINTYPESKTFTFSNSGSKFSLVNSSGGSLGSFTINAEDTQEYDVYVQRNNGATFPSSPQKINLYFTPNGGSRTSIGTVSVQVNVDYTITDDEPPLISNVNGDIVYEDGKVKVSWDASDDSGLHHFIIEVFDGDDQLLDTITTTDATQNYTVSGLDAGTYYFKVYGVDASINHNNGKNKATTCSTNEGYCSRSTSSSYKWLLNVTNNCQNCTFTGNNNVMIGQTYTARVQASNWFTLPDTITVTMGGNTLNANSYTYTQNNGNISIPNVTGDLNIQVNANFSCLIKGTKILLANGNYKNIEDITYNDLLAVWSYETGSITYEYPIWIEKKSISDKYTKITFDDNTLLGVVALHGLFSPTYNEFLAVNDKDKFKVGTEILKIRNGNFNNVKISKIETIQDEVEYYHVVSTRYYNVIANDILTTDGTVVLSNLYGFDKNVTWPKERIAIMNNGVYSYDDFKDILPYYMFKGMRVEEGKHLENFGLSKEIFKYYLANNQVNDHMIKYVDTNSKGNRVWMVTTSLDNVNEFNKSNYLIEEGTYYTLRIVNGVKKYYSTSENKYYNPGDIIKIEHGMHFIAIK